MLSVDTAAEPATAAAHFAARLQFETDVSDVHDALHETPDALVVVDSRGQAAWDQGHVPDALHLPTPYIADRATALIPRDVLVVTYCWGPACNGATRAALEFARLGYRVKEVLFGQSTEGVGRTNAVTGSLSIAGSTVEKGDFTVDMTTVKSDSGNRDNQFQGRIMDTSKFPTSTFALTQPIDLGSVPAEGQTVTASATGDLTLHGATKPVTFDVQAQLKDGKIEVNGTIPIVFADYGIPNPSFGPASTEDNGVLEFLLVFTKG